MLTKPSTYPRETLYLKGRFDAHKVPKLRHKLEALHKDIHLDMREVSFIDSMGLSFLVNLHKQANAKGLDFQLLNVQDSVRIIFETTQLDDILPFHCATDDT